MKKRSLSLWGIIMMLGSVIALITCLNPSGIDPDSGLIQINIPDKIETADVTAAVLMLTNRSKTVDVTNVIITQPEWSAPQGNPNAQPPSISFTNRPKRLEKKAQYLTPSDKNYQLVIDYAFDAWKGTPAGTGTQTITIPLPLPRQIVEFIIYRDKDGVVIVDKETVDPDPGDIGNPAEDTSIGEGSSPAIIPPESRNKMATFVVVSKTNSQIIDSVAFKMGDTQYTMGGIGIHDKQSIALGQGTWETRLTYTRGEEKTLGSLNSIVVPSNDPQAAQEHYLYFYLNKHGDYAISQTWPPFPNDVEEEDMLPPDNGYGRGVIKIINNSYAMAEMVTIHNLKDKTKFPMTIDYGRFSPSIPIQYNKTGYVDVIGTEEFPIEAHEGYLVQVTMENSEGAPTIIERKAYIKDQVVLIVISQSDLTFNNAQGAKVTLENNTEDWPVEITYLTVRNRANAWQSSYYNENAWNPAGSIKEGESATLYVMSTTAMPITQSATFDALVSIRGGGKTAVVTKSFSPAELYSELSPDKNTRTIAITDSDVPSDVKDGLMGATVTLQNRISSCPVEIIGMTVRNKTNTDQNAAYGTTTWTPYGVIFNGEDAVQIVMATTAMPINPGVEFEALITLHSSGITETITKSFSPAVLYSDKAFHQNIRTITINDSDVPLSIKNSVRGNGATIIIKNAVKAEWPIQITAMQLWDKPVQTQFAFYGYNTFEPIGMITNGKEARQVVLSSDTFTMAPGIEYEACITIYGYNGRIRTITKTLDPAELYSDKTPDLNTRLITIEDGDIPSELETPPVMPPDPLANGANVTLINNTSSWPADIIGMRVRNKAVNTENTFYATANWIPQGPITKSNSAVQAVLASAGMPIAAGVEFEARITLSYNGETEIITKQFSPKAELYSTLPLAQNTRTVTIDDSDVPDKIKDAYILSRGAIVTLENHVSAWPVQITGMKVQHKTNTSKSTNYNNTTWEPKSPIDNGRSAVQMVMSSHAMPIQSGIQFEAVITLSGNGNTATITKPFNPAVLFSANDPARNPRTIIITDSDVPASVQTPEPPPPQPPDIGGAKEGDTIVIDGIEWIKVRTDTHNPDLVLLMLKGVTGLSVPYDLPLMCREYGATNPPTIKSYVDTWYANLNSPTLKRIAWKVNLGFPSWPVWVGNGLAGENNFVTIAFIPCLQDIGHLMKANGYRYWLSNLDCGCSIIKENGDSILGNISPNTLTVYVRPCIWVTTNL
jgi:hypothetical protein